jgi:hypothetical protein
MGLKSSACLRSPTLSGKQINTIHCKVVNMRRFIAPLRVRATPKRAVRVGNTQSAYAPSADFICNIKP